jgi:glycosyltransferase involved in cell wall biosynthesis
MWGFFYSLAHSNGMKNKVTINSSEKSVTIIIATFNVVNDIEETINSCLSQDFNSKKIVIIDGGSRDGTVNILNARTSDIAYWISENDGGIYSAWNKALQVIDSEWITFLGAGDVWFDTASLSQMLTFANFPHINFVSGKVVLSDSGCRVTSKGIGKPFTYWNMIFHMGIAHPGSLHHISLFKNNFFNESFKIAGDYEFLLRRIGDIRSAYNPSEIVRMRAGGISQTSTKLVRLESARALRSTHFIGPLVAVIFNIRFFLSQMTKSKK